MAAALPQQTGVVVAGGGLVGLTAGLLLQQLHVPFVLVEKSLKDSVLPRSRGIHLRSMEIFRQLGLEEHVKAAAQSSWEQGGFGGARRGRTMLEAESLALNFTKSLQTMTKQDPSPSSFCACPQSLLEPTLLQPLRERGADVRLGCELLSFHDTGDGVDCTVRDKDGVEGHITASYLLGADGGRSLISRQLGVGSDTVPAQTYYLNVFFRADLTEQVKGRTFSQCEVANDAVRGNFSSKNNTTEWSFHLDYDPAKESPERYDDARLIEHVQAAVGADIPIELLARPSRWNTAVKIAKRYRVGRVFLAGDAAHQWPPWGGFGGNTGIADVQNLAWKLAATMAGTAPANLLDSYEVERRPVAVCCGRQALLRSDFDARFGIKTESNEEDMKQQLDISGVLLRYRYASTGGQTGEPVAQLQAQTGTRFPHADIRRAGETQSTLDLFGTSSSYALLLGPAASSAWRNGVQSPSNTGIYMVERDFEFSEGGTNWASLTGLADDGVVLVRPDGFVADRSDETLRPTA